VVELDLGDVLAAVDRVHDHHVALDRRLLAALLHPLHERAGLLDEAEPHQRVDSESRVAEPGVPVVPVPDAAHLLGQRRRGCRDERAGGVVDEELQRERGPLDVLAPAAAVAGLADPALPELAGLVEQLVDLVALQGPDLAVPLELEIDRLAMVEAEGRPDGVTVAMQRNVTAQHTTAGRRGEPRTDTVDDLDVVRHPRIVEGRLADEVERGPPTDGRRAADQEVARRGHQPGGGDHEVDDLAHRVGREEPREEGVRVGEVELLRPGGGAAGEAEVAALLRIEQGGEQRRRVEAGRAVPVDGRVGSHEGDGAQVTDDRVFLDGKVMAPGSRPTVDHVSILLRRHYTSVSARWLDADRLLPSACLSGE
jgi:hypothetical protein